MVEKLGEYWRITAPDDSGPIPVSLNVSQQPAFSDDTLSYEFVFRALPGDDRGAFRERHARVLTYQPTVADEFALGHSMAGAPWYRETHNEEGLSALAAIRPPDEMQADDTGRGLWCLIESVEDETNLPQTRWALTAGVRYLASLDEYADHAAVRNALEREGVGL